MSFNGARLISEMVLLILLMTITVFGQPAQPDSVVSESLVKAREAYLKKEFLLGKQELKRVQAANKGLAEPYFLLGMIAWHEGKINDAIKSSLPLNRETTIVGMLNEKGEFTLFAVASSDTIVEKRDELIKAVLAHKYTPAIVNGVPAPIWLHITYTKSSSVSVGR